ncbi:MAG TPA: DNA glycosylase [Nitrosopumilaceae archaeon]|nr:DNA glycosylase [Nitrosopumilaceae archaeon]
MKLSPFEMVDYCKINLENSINSGQVFLWEQKQNNWYGINGRDILRINESGKIKSFSKQKIDYFREKDDLEEILRSISKDTTTRKAVRKYLGLRLLRQDPFQCYISFIVSSNSNIQKIKTCLEKICKNFGKKVFFDGSEFFLFPEPKTLASASIQEIKICGVGYRSNFIKIASEMVCSNEINFEYLKKCEYGKAKEILSKVPGVGNKVADCILLFSLDKLEAFPLDRWMIRILEKYYPDTFEISTKSITHNQYEILHEKILNYFGPYSGYAQQFLFKMERENYKKKWL